MQHQRNTTFVRGLLKVFPGTCVYKNYKLIFSRNKTGGVQRAVCGVLGETQFLDLSGVA